MQISSLAALPRMFTDGRLFKRIKLFAQYLFFHLLEAINPDLSLQRPKFSQERRRAPPLPSDRTSSIEFHLDPDDNARKEFSQPNAQRRALVTQVADKFRTSRCFVCDAPLKPIIQVVNADDQQDYIEVSWCGACDHLQYSVMPSKDWITRWYETAWDRTSTLDQQLESRPVTYRYYRRLAPHIGTRKLKILEIGAGYGDKIAPFKEAGHEIHCTEATPPRADYLRRTLTKNVYLGTLDDPAVEHAVRANGPYDLIFTYHVIEHIYNPRAELQILRDVTTPDALFYLAIPELYKEGILNNIYALEHIESFSRRSAKALLKQIGFRPIVAKDDLFQYYSNLCQYLIGKRTESSDVLALEKNDDPEKMVSYLTRALKLNRIAELDRSTFSYAYDSHARLTYNVSKESKDKCRNPAAHLPIRIYHRGLPLFWTYS
jgi:2-polyprenyl-3-methyl-5-hydroxy-6-metoxy-1,4-benzoquinol methylase